MGDLLNVTLMGGDWDALDDVLGVLMTLCLVCSDASLAYAYARLRKQWAARGLVASGRPGPGGRRAGHDDYPAAVESARQCGIAYAAAATRLAAAAASAAGHLAAGQPPPVPQPSGV